MNDRGFFKMTEDVQLFIGPSMNETVTKEQIAPEKPRRYNPDMMEADRAAFAKNEADSCYHHSVN